MKSLAKLSALLCLSIAIGSPIAVLAQPQITSPTPVEQAASPQPNFANQALVVYFPEAFEKRLEKNQSFGVTLRLAKPLIDANGQVIAPEHSLVMANIITTRKTVELVAEAVEVNGQLLSVNANGPEITGDRMAQKPTLEAASETARFVSSLAGAGIRTFNLNEMTSSRVDFAGLAIGAIFGLTRSKRYYISIPQNRIFVLKTAFAS